MWWRGSDQAGAGKSGPALWELTSRRWPAVWVGEEKEEVEETDEASGEEDIDDGDDWKWEAVLEDERTIWS